MTPTTVLARNGSTLSEAVQADSWYSYLGGCQPADLVDDLVKALLHAQQTEFNHLLPQRCYWYMSTSEIIGPADQEFDVDVDELMRQASATVAERFEEIEADVKNNQDTY